MKPCVYNGTTSVDYLEESKNIVQYFMTLYFNTMRLFSNWLYSFVPKTTKFLNANLQ